ncbi:MAG: hypothetical protein RJA49_2125 [Actinomycetota bacterium]
MARGELRVYLGAAPGVGKTFAMLDEGFRRRERGADVVVAVVETHGRTKTAAQLRDLDVVPRTTIIHRGAAIPEMDLDAVLARRPSVALVDELAHTNAPGSRNVKRWQDVEELLAAGIHVITTVNIQHLESLNDVVERITGVTQRETVPDDVVRRADQIELVDMSPEALRRRLAHGNVYPADRVDAALRNYFRAGNLAALRELALLWVADRVEDGLDDYRARHGITAAWETRERVVVALTGAPGGDRLIRRAARIAARSRGELVGVHVTSGDGLRRAVEDERLTLEQHRALLHELGGRYHEISGDDVARALVEFARSQAATQLVLGASSSPRRLPWRARSVLTRIVVDASGVDVHVIATPEAPPARTRVRQRRAGALPLRRVLLGWAIVVIGLPLLTVALSSNRSGISLATDLLIYLGVVVAAAAVGGVGPGVVGAVAGSLFANWFLVPPVHTFTIGQAENALALVVFVAIAGTVSGYVDLAARRAHEARRAQADAEALALTTATLLSAPDPLPALVDQVRATFRLDGVALLHQQDDGTWRTVAMSGVVPSDGEARRSLTVGSEGNGLLVFSGRLLSADEERSLRSHAGQLSLAESAREHHQEAARVATLEEIDHLRTAMLRSVSHDLRTPLASIKTVTTSLLSTEVAWDADTTKEFLETIDTETDRLTRLVENLLDMSRLQAGAVSLHLQAVAVEDVVANAVASISRDTSRVEIAIPEGLPLGWVDSVLLERALANIIGNALDWSPADAHVVVRAEALDGEVALAVVDHGPGIPADERARVMSPFQRFDDGGSPHGTGLGLAVAEGFVAAMRGRVQLDHTPGGGLTVSVFVPTGPPDEPMADRR